VCDTATEKLLEYGLQQTRCNVQQPTHDNKVTVDSDFSANHLAGSNEKTSMWFKTCSNLNTTSMWTCSIKMSTLL